MSAAKDGATTDGATTDGATTDRDTTFDPDQAWKALSLVNDWVKHAEAKSATTLAATGVTGGVLYNLVKGQNEPGFWLTVLAGLSGVAVFLAGVCALLALIPRTGRARRFWTRIRGVGRPDPATAPDEDPANLLFFKDVTQGYGSDSPTYTAVFGALTSDKKKLTEHIARQIHANSGVAHRKFKWAERAIRWLAVALVALAWVAVIVGKRYGG
jgi:hypothetical protein